MARHIGNEELDWQDIRFFVALAEHGSLSATARALRVHHATVSRRLAALEERLGRTLFEVGGSGYVPTIQGRALLDHARGMEAAASALLRSLDTGADVAGLVRITATQAMADCLLVPHLAGFAERWPTIDIEVVADLRPLSLHHRQADIALRIGRPGDGTAVARRLLTLHYGFFASPGLAGRLRDGLPPAFVSFDADNAALPEATFIARNHGGARISFRSASQLAQAEAARGGLGVALLPRYLADGGGLVEVDCGPVPPSREVWLLLRPDLKAVPRVRAVVDFLVSALRERSALPPPSI